jgi:hypothetical protein
METYINKAGGILTINDIADAGNDLVTIVKNGKKVTKRISKADLNSTLYNGEYNLVQTDHHIVAFHKLHRTPQLCLSDFGGKEVVFNRGGRQYTGWLAGHDATNKTFVVRTGAEWGYRLTELSPDVTYVNGETNINCRMADVPYNDIIFLQW